MAGYLAVYVVHASLREPMLIEAQEELVELAAPARAE